MTIGYGDIVPTNPVERGVAIVTILSGGVFFAYAINKIGNILTIAWQKKEKMLY